MKKLHFRIQPQVWESCKKKESGINCNVFLKILGVVAHTFKFLALRKQRQLDHHEFEPGLVYTVNK